MMQLLTFKVACSACIGLLILIACDNKTSAAEPVKPAKTGFDQLRLKKNFAGNELPPCGKESISVTQEKNALSLLKLGMKGITLEEYRNCYKSEFLK